MKVLLLDETFGADPRGAVPYTRDLLNYGRGQGNEVDLLTVGDGPTSIERGDRGCIYRMRCDGEFNSARVSLAALRRIVYSFNDYGIVHANHPNPTGDIGTLAACRMRKRKAFVVVTFHAEVVSAKRFSKLYNALVTTPLLQVADRIIATSPQMAETAPVLRGVAEKITVIPFGVEAPGEPGPKPNSPDPATGLRLLFVGRLARYKGLEVLLHALGRTRSALRIVGEGALRSEIDQLVTRLGLHDRVTLLGRVPDRVLDEMYQWADVLVLPSTDRGEAFGYVLIEAMARGVALITTELGTGTSWVNLTEETGLVVRPGDPSALAAAIKRLESDRPLLKRCQMNALRRFQANFVLKRMVRDTYDLYERELLERSKCPVKPCRRETNDDHSPGLPSLH